MRCIVLVLLPLLGVPAYYVAVHAGGEAFRRALISERGPIELGTAALYLVSAVIALALVTRTRRSVPRFYRALYGLFAVAAVFVALEEVSYGQHLLGWKSPRWFAEHNVKGEVNLHNLYGDRPTRGLRNVGLFGYAAVGIVLPGAVWLVHRQYPPGRWAHYLLPRGELVPLVAVALVLRRLRKLPSSGFTGLGLGLDEVMELYLAAAALVYMIVLWRRLVRA